MYNSLRLIVLAVFLAVSLPVGAQTLWDGWDYKYDREILPWSELVADLPPYPSDNTLIPLEIDVVTPHRYFVDAKSLSTGKDGVVRYTLVVKTAGGATNVSFEGIRCDSAEQKYYAIGRPVERTWVRARDPQWRAFSARQGGAHHASLYQWYFCRTKSAEPLDRIQRALRSGIPRTQLLE